MRFFNTVVAAALGIVMCSACGPKGTLEGEWYGLKGKEVVTVKFNPDQTIEANDGAMMTFKAPYSLNSEKDPMEIDINGAVQGMSMAGIMRMNADNTLDINLAVNVPGISEGRPTTFEAPQGMAAMASLCLKLSKDKKAIMAKLGPKPKISPAVKVAWERNARLGSGINLNAVVDGNRHPGYERDAPLGDDEIKSIADAGFQSVRLDVCWVKHCAAEAPYTIDQEFFDKVDHIINECFKNGLAVSIDQHYYPYINMDGECTDAEYEENFNRLDCLWSQLAEHYKDYSNDLLFFDLLNEPNMRLGADRWNETVAMLTKTIRKTNPDRTLLVLTPNLGQYWTLKQLELPADEWNIIVQFHYYMPHLFTHHGLSYAMAGESDMTTWEGSEEDKASIRKDFDTCTAWMKENGRPLNLGEYGAVNTVDPASRARYIGFICTEAKSRGFSTHLWGYRECFQICNEDKNSPDYGKWLQPVLDAMKLK